MNWLRSLPIPVLLLTMVLAAPAGNSKPLTDLENRPVHPLDTAGHPATVLFFVWHTCPVANSYAPEIERIYNEYKDRGVRVFLVQVDPDLTVEKAREHAKDYGYTMPVVIDREHELVKATHATMTPEAVILLPNGKQVYRGRIDDRQAALGKRRPEATQTDVRDVLDAILSGKPPEPRVTTSVGCYIPDLD